MSGEPDLDGVPAPLRQVVGKALAKEPDARPSAAEAARMCGELLASQVTQVLPAGAVPETAVDMVTALWDVPAEADPAWHVPPERPRSKRRLVGAVVLVAAVVGGLAGGAAALMPGGTGNGERTFLRHSPGIAPRLGRFPTAVHGHREGRHGGRETAGLGR
ncbi:hypothetical protein [Streptomyces sp. YIM B13508]|uniref:hypothetical protein n=1 Tax=Streptomyces sp. YIM B13508 TaxID=3366315 RepID=UPI00369E026E